MSSSKFPTGPRPVADPAKPVVPEKPEDAVAPPPGGSRLPPFAPQPPPDLKPHGSQPIPLPKRPFLANPLKAPSAPAPSTPAPSTPAPSAEMPDDVLTTGYQAAFSEQYRQLLQQTVGSRLGEGTFGEATVVSQVDASGMLKSEVIKRLKGPEEIAKTMALKALGQYRDWKAADDKGKRRITDSPAYRHHYKVALPTAQEQFQAAKHALPREIEMMRRARDGGAPVVEVLGYDEQSIRMRVASGGELYRLLVQYPPIDATTRRQLVSAATECLVLLHGTGVRHRDLKPENLLLEPTTPKIDPETRLPVPNQPRWRLMIGDFGCATTNPTSSTNCGTPNFKAPEVSAALYDTHQADVWSMACVIYSILTGQLPHSPQDKSQVLYPPDFGERMERLGLNGYDLRAFFAHAFAPRHLRPNSSRLRELWTRIERGEPSEAPLTSDGVHTSVRTEVRHGTLLVVKRSNSAEGRSDIARETAMLRKILAHEMGMAHKSVPKPVSVSADELAVASSEVTSAHGLITFAPRRFDPEQPHWFHEKARIMSQLLERVRNIHAAGVAHLNLQPECFVPHGGPKRIEVRVGNFEFATDEQETSRKAGQSRYTAPEARGDQPYNSFRADIWSLGAILYQASTGELPEDAQQIPQHLPPGLRQLLAAALDPDPLRRPVAQELMRQWNDLGNAGVFG